MIKERVQKISLLKSKNLIFLLIFILITIVFFKVITLPTHAPLTGYWSRSWESDHWEYNCTNCSDCNDAIANASGSSGDIIRLNTSISNQDGNCIDFNGTDNITFDCQDNYIEGDGDMNGYGIYLSDANGGSNNNTIKNCNITEFSYGIRTEEDSDNNTIINITSNNNQYDGILIQSLENTLINITANNNSYVGINVQANYNILRNITVQENGRWDIGAVFTTCEGVIMENINGSGGRPIEFYNSSVTIQHRNNLSELILCNADGSTINNVTIRGSDTKNNNYLHLIETDNTDITNVNSSGNYYGLYLLEYSDNNTLINITTNSNSHTGIYLYQSSPNTIRNITSNNNGADGLSLDSAATGIIKDTTTSYNSIYGIELSGSDNIQIINAISNGNGRGITFDTAADNNNLTNITTNNNTYGIYFSDSDDYNKINDSRIENNTYGIYFSEDLPHIAEYNLIYNNLFNNSINYYNSTNLTNYFNTTNQSGTNIIGGSTIGGNYWGYPNGTGFSDTCADADSDGICTSTYSLDGDNYDYLPLAGGGCTESWTCTAWSVCSGGTQTRTCTDSNACGTTVNKPAESQTCTVGEPGGGVTKDQPTETETWTEITPEEPLEMNITDPEIDLTKITVEVSETVQDVSIEITQIDVVPLADIKIGMVGGTYQSFKIETIGINDTNIESVTMEFKVNKTWISEEGGTAEDMKLYKKQDIGNKWDELQTILSGSDSDYYYFSSTLPSFSIFIVVIDLSRCNNNNICEIELGENEINCPNDCGVKKGFFEIMKQSYLWIIIILTLMIVMVLVTLIIRLKRKKRLTQMMEK